MTEPNMEKKRKRSRKKKNAGDADEKDPVKEILALSNQPLKLDTQLTFGLPHEELGDKSPTELYNLNKFVS